MDDAGGPLPGVTIEIRSVEKGTLRTGVTGAIGAARFVALAPGGWSVKAMLSGFSAAEEKSVVLRVGQTQVVKITLRATRSEAVTVTATETAPLVDVYKLDTSTNIIPEQIQALPVANRNFEQLAFLAPTVQRERGEFRFVTGGPVIGSVGNASQSTFLVDGVDYTDPALGLSKTRISQDAISEFRVISNRFDTEVGQSAGGALSVVTRSGSNAFAGTAYGFYRDERPDRQAAAPARHEPLHLPRRLRRDARRPDREGPDLLLPLGRAGGPVDADLLPAARRLYVARRRHPRFRSTRRFSSET